MPGYHSEVHMWEIKEQYEQRFRVCSFRNDESPRIYLNWEQFTSTECLLYDRQKSQYFISPDNFQLKARRY